MSRSIDVHLFIKAIELFDEGELRLARSQMHPVNRLSEFPPSGINAKQSAVLIIFTLLNNELSLVFIQRTKDQTVHSGQIAFPGGRFDETAGDQSVKDTALRETFEEIGVICSKDDILAELMPLYIPPSNFMMFPFITFIESLPEFHRSITEVDEVFVIPVSSLLSKEARGEGLFETIRGQVKAPCFVWGNVKIWGATAIILSEILFVYRKMTTP